MFAPEGYLPLLAVLSRLSEIGSDRIRPTLAIEWQKKVIANGGSLSRNHAHDALLALDIFPVWACASILTYDLIPTYLCSPCGKIMRASQQFFQGFDRLNFPYFSLPAENGDETAAIIDHVSTAGRKFDPWVGFDTGWFLCLETGCIRTPEEIETRVPSEISSKTLKKVAASFSGWAVCVKADALLIDDADLLALLDAFFDYAKDGVGSDITTTSDITAEIIRRFDAGDVVIRDKIRAELAKGIKYDSWKAIWKDATLLRPRLSRRGPKGQKR